MDHFPLWSESLTLPFLRLSVKQKPPLSLIEKGSVGTITNAKCRLRALSALNLQVAELFGSSLAVLLLYGFFSCRMSHRLFICIVGIEQRQRICCVEWILPDRLLRRLASIT